MMGGGPCAHGRTEPSTETWPCRELPSPPHLSTALVTKLLLSGKEGQLTSSPGGRSPPAAWAPQPCACPPLLTVPRWGALLRRTSSLRVWMEKSGAGVDFTLGPQQRWVQSEPTHHGARSGWVPGPGRSCSGAGVVGNGLVLRALCVCRAEQPAVGLPAARGQRCTRRVARGLTSSPRPCG